jgi:hypothetical protein
VLTLPVPGTYTVLIDGTDASIGSTTVTLYDVPADVTGPIAFSNPVPITLGPPGQNARLTFTGAANQRVSLKLTDTTITSGAMAILKPPPPVSDGATLGSIGFAANSTGFLDVLTLPLAGTYTVLVNPSFAYTGITTATLYDVPADYTGTLTVNGPAVPVSLGSPGQNGSLTFTGNANQQVTVHITGNDIGLVYVYLRNSAGGTLAQAGSGAVNFNLLQVTLPSTPPTDTYTVKIDPDMANTGTLNVSVTSP